MSENLELWHKVEKTPESQTKAITGKPYKGTSPKPYFLVQKATETFGPCGIGWGFEIVNERVENGADGDKVHIAHIRVWYEWNGKRGQVEHVGQTMLAGKNRNGPFTDEDAPKKSVTDALVKALSMIGFAGDIFMGRYDDSKYVSELKEEERRAEASTKPAEPKPTSAAEQKRQLLEIDKDLLDAHSDADVKRCAEIWQSIATRDNWSRDYRIAAKEKFDARRELLRKGSTVSDIEDTFPGSNVVDERVSDAEASRHPLNA